MHLVLACFDYLHMCRLLLYMSCTHWKDLCSRLKAIVKDGHSVAVRVDIRVVRSCFDSWREMKLTDPIEKVLFMEPICHVTKMLRISRCINDEYEKHLCFMSWKNKMCEKRLHAHFGRWIIERRLRRMQRKSFTEIFGFTLLSKTLLVVGFKVGRNSIRSVQRAVFLEIRKYSLRRKSLMAMGLKVATKSVMVLVKKVLNFWFSMVLEHTSYSGSNVGMILAGRNKKFKTRMYYSAWNLLAKECKSLFFRDEKVQQRTQKKRVGSNFSRWHRCTIRSRVLSHAENHVHWIFARGCIRPCFAKWARMHLRRQCFWREVQSLDKRKILHIVRAHLMAWIHTFRCISTLRVSIISGFLKSNNKITSKQILTRWTLQTSKRRKYMHIVQRLGRRLQRVLLEAVVQAWLQGILHKYKKLPKTSHDVELRSLLDEYDLSQDDGARIRAALSERRKLDNVIGMLSHVTTRLRMVMPVFHTWRHNIGTWMPRAALGWALASKALLDISPVPPDLHVSSSRALATSESGMNDADPSGALQQLRHPANRYAKVRALQDILLRWEWVVQWGRTKGLIAWRYSSSKMQVCWKVWCLTVSHSHLLRHAALKILSWTSVRDKGTCFRAWAVACRKCISRLHALGDIVDYQDDRRVHLLLRDVFGNWTDITRCNDGSKEDVKDDDKDDATSQPECCANEHTDGLQGISEACSFCGMISSPKGSAISQVDSDDDQFARLPSSPTAAAAAAAAARVEVIHREGERESARAKKEKRGRAREREREREKVRPLMWERKRKKEIERESVSVCVWRVCVCVCVREGGKEREGARESACVRASGKSIMGVSVHRVQISLIDTIFVCVVGFSRK